MIDVFLIGAARSGTTLLGKQILSKSKQIHYLGEADYLWAEAYTMIDDRIENNVISHRAKEQIHKKCRYIKESAPEGSLVIEKSPANCFRVSFLAEQFPNARFVYIERNPFDVIQSAKKEWKQEKSDALDSKVIRNSGFLSSIALTVKRDFNIRTHFFNLYDFKYLPSYIRRFLKYLFRKLCGKWRIIHWGPRYPGYKNDTSSVTNRCAKQWYYSTRYAKEALNDLPKERVCYLKYSDLVREPEKQVKLLCEFIEINYDASLVSAVRHRINDGNSSHKPILCEIEDTSILTEIKNYE